MRLHNNYYNTVLTLVTKERKVIALVVGITIASMKSIISPLMMGLVKNICEQFVLGWTVYPVR